jgi:hypothetical protein
LGELRRTEQKLFKFCMDRCFTFLVKVLAADHFDSPSRSPQICNCQAQFFRIFFEKNIIKSDLNRKTVKMPNRQWHNGMKPRILPINQIDALFVASSAHDTQPSPHCEQHKNEQVNFQSKTQCNFWVPFLYALPSLSSNKNQSHDKI